MRVLCGGPARETSSDLYKLHVEGLRAQGSMGSEKAECGGTPSSAPAFDVVVHHEVVPDMGGPRWHHEKIGRVAQARQKMLDMTCGHLVGLGPDYDALLMVDTDVILGPGVLDRMWAVDADVVFGVFWTAGDWGNAPGVDAWPNVWDRHSYRFTEECWNDLTAPGIHEVEVLGGGAVTLLRGRAFESRYWPLPASLSAFSDMLCGEDRAFNLGCELRDIRQVAVVGLPIVHLYTPELHTPAKLKEARALVGLFDEAKIV